LSRQLVDDLTWAVSWTATLQGADVGERRAFRENPHLDSSIEKRIAFLVRTSITEVPHCYASGIDALFGDEVIARVVGASERYAHALGRIAMPVDHERRSRVLL